MSYIQKDSDVVVSARLTQKGRELLSVGLLTFNTFKLGDSEVDYTTLGTTYDITLDNVLRAKACQPEIKTPILPLPTNTASNSSVGIPTLTPITLETIRMSPEKGFFLTGYTTSGFSGTFEVATSTKYVLQADTMIPLNLLSGGTSGSTYVVPVRQSSSYSANTYEPQIGDYMFVKMSNDVISGSSQIDGQIDIDYPVPYLWFKVQDKTGTLSADTLNVTIDREFAYFDGYAGSNYCWTVFYPGGDPFVNGGMYSGGCVWNQNNVWSNNIAGVNPATYETFENYGSENYVGTKEYFGYTSEITGSCAEVRSISVIHFTNPQSCENQSELTYGQKFYLDLDNTERPMLKIPTLMWHNELETVTGTTGYKIGHTFVGDGSVENFVTLSGAPTTIRYYDLVDETEFSVGRVFPDQHVITVHDQELVAALSYKSNRNWTLPTLEYGLASSLDGLIGQTQDLYVSYLFETTSGYTTGIHAQNYTCVVVGEEDCPDNSKKDVEIYFPSGQLPFLNDGTTGSTLSPGTGWRADKFHLLVQRVATGTKPDPNGWRIIEYTSSIDSHTVGDDISPINIENTTFLVTLSDYVSAPVYNLHDYINIPETFETDLLQFGDEQFFYGNFCTSNITTKYRTKFNFTIPPTQYNTTTNPTWPNSGQNVHISEIGIYSNTGDLVAIGKMNLPIEKTNSTTIIIEIAFDL